LLAATLITSRGGAGTKVQPIAWHACTGGQCATLTVPLDYSFGQVYANMFPGRGASEIGAVRLAVRDAG